MKTVCIQIGNSDRKLTRVEWTNFIKEVLNLVRSESTNIWFSGYSLPTDPWENACYIFSLHEKDIPQFKNKLELIRKDFNQDSVAWLEGETYFV